MQPNIYEAFIQTADMDQFNIVDPPPGANLSVLTNADPKRIVEIAQEASVESKENQQDHLRRRLYTYLQHLSDTPGARLILRQYYRTRFDMRIDSFDLSTLTNHISAQNLLEGDALPVLTKDQIRHDFGVEGADPNGAGGKLTLIPDWVNAHEKEPHMVLTTSGTSSKPWARAVTRNDWALVLILTVRLIVEIFNSADLNHQQCRVAIFTPPGHLATEAFSDSFELLGTSVKTVDIDRLNGGGTRAQEEFDRVQKFVNGGRHGAIVGPMASLLEKSEVQYFIENSLSVDLSVNIGRPFTRTARKKLSDLDSATANVFGETEYPQGGGWERRVGDAVGFDLPLEGQLNTIFDPREGELKRKGTGRLAYFPFALEGQIIPGFYMSDVRGRLVKKFDGTRQCNILSDIEREVSTSRKTNYFPE